MKIGGRTSKHLGEAIGVMLLGITLASCGAASRTTEAISTPTSALATALASAPPSGNSGERVVATAVPAPTGSARAIGTPRTGGARPRGGVECVAAVLQRHPINLAPYEAMTGRAGEAQFTRPLFLNRVFTEFGFVIPAAVTSTGNDKPNPQPTYLAPMGTTVYSAVDGVVEQIASLWSTPTLGDVSVMVKPDGLAEGCYVVVEMEHVVNPLVGAGDRVKAGQPLAQVSPLNSQGNRGLGMVEFGILTGAGNGRPLHVCPYAYFTPAVRDAQLAILGRLMADWETFAGDMKLYDETRWQGGIIGCRSGPIEE